MRPSLQRVHPSAENPQMIPSSRRIYLSAGCIFLLIGSGLCGLVRGDGKMLYENPKDPHLVEVEFYFDNTPLQQQGNILMSSWISERHQGSEGDIFNWAIQGGFKADPTGREDAAACLTTLKTLVEPKRLPSSPIQILTIRCRDGGSILTKRFPLREVPIEARPILNAVGLDQKTIARYYDRIQFASHHEAWNMDM
jgi:hypothetical protein